MLGLQEEQRLFNVRIINLDIGNSEGAKLSYKKFPCVLQIWK